MKWEDVDQVQDLILMENNTVVIIGLLFRLMIYKAYCTERGESFDQDADGNYDTRPNLRQRPGFD